MKKVYSQPQTIDVKLASNMLMQQLVAGSDAKAGEGADAPARGYGVKYL